MKKISITLAILFVHGFGHSCAMDPFKKAKVAEQTARNGLTLEQAAERKDMMDDFERVVRVQAAHDGRKKKLGIASRIRGFILKPFSSHSQLVWSPQAEIPMQQHPEDLV